MPSMDVDRETQRIVQCVNNHDGTIATDRLINALREIAGIAGACVVQRAPSDDRIIAEHIEEIRDLAWASLEQARKP